MKAATVVGLINGRLSSISIHAAREGGDSHMSMPVFGQIKFQSTPPVKAATAFEIEDKYGAMISIHAAREGGDKTELVMTANLRISIHAAREGGDIYMVHVNISICPFQSTPPVKAATAETNRRNQHFRKQQV